MVDAVRQVVSGQFQSVTRGVINNVAGNIMGMIGGAKDNSPTAALNNKTKFYTENLQYPMNVEGDPMQGHYILFMINQLSGKTKIKTKESKHMESIKNQIQHDMSADIRSKGGGFGQGADEGVADQFGDLFYDSGGKVIKVKDTRGGDGPAGKGNRHGSLVAEQLASQSMSTAIALYMPANVSTTYDIQYSDTEIGVAASAITQFADVLTNAFNNFSVDNLVSDIKGMAPTAEQGAKRAILKSLDAVAPGVRAAAEIRAGSILSSKMEMAFKGINRRSFSFTFIFMPKSEQEAEIVQRIIHMFKFHAHGQYGSDAVTSGGATSDEFVTAASASPMVLGYEMAMPDTFDIRYMYQGQQNTHLNKISTCFLENIQVAYGGDRYVAYKPTRSMHGDTTPPPQRTTLTLQFKEIEILDRTRIDEGF